jgi:hypothetical protein
MTIAKKRTALAILLALGKGISIASAASENISGPSALALAGVVERKRRPSHGSVSAISREP